MSAIVNHLHFWSILDMEAKRHSATPAQLEAIKKLHETIQDRSFAGSVFNELTVSKVEDILAITVRECGDDLQLVVDGKWFTLAIEGDGYLVLTGSEVSHARTGYPR